MALPKDQRLGLSASAAEGVRDCLRIDVDSLRRDLAILVGMVDGLPLAISSLKEHIDELEESTLDLLENLIQGNADAGNALHKVEE